MSQRQEILFPVGRLVRGSLYDPNKSDFAGKPLTVKTGPNAGQPRVDYFFAVAIPKGAEQHWAYTEYGAKIWAIGHAFMANAGQMGANFAWKVIDGDSTAPNKNGVKPCDLEGYPGHWVIRFGGGYPPKIFTANGSEQLLQKDHVNPGDYVQVYGSVSANDNAQNPGVYVNHSMVAFQAFGPRIVIGPNPNAVGFGQGVQLPASASATPQGGQFNPAAPPPAAPAAPGAGYPPAPGYAPPPAPGNAPAANLPPPHPGFLPAPSSAAAPGYAAPPPSATPPAPGYPPAPPGAATYPSSPPPGPVMIEPAAKGLSYDAWRGAGWTDDAMRQHGIMR